jgi:hypothetical protein
VKNTPAARSLLDNNLAWGAVCLLLPLLVLAVTAAASAELDIPFGSFSRDPAANEAFHPLVGALSHLGVLAWYSAAVCCLQAWAVLRRRPSRRPEEGAMFLAAGLLAALLATDDLFMFHDRLLPWAGISEKLVMLTYAGLLLAVLLRFRRLFLTRNPLLFAVALGFFALSVLVDLTLSSRLNPHWHHLFEDGPKFVGQVGWLGYFWQQTTRALAETTSSD